MSLPETTAPVSAVVIGEDERVFAISLELAQGFGETPGHGDDADLVVLGRGELTAPLRALDGQLAGAPLDRGPVQAADLTGAEARVAAE